MIDKTKGWFGLEDEVIAFLREVNADADEKGNFYIYEQQLTYGLDPAEVVVGGGTLYSIKGEYKPLAEGLIKARKGLSVLVI